MRRPTIALIALMVAATARDAGADPAPSATDPAPRRDRGWMARHERCLGRLRPGTAGLIFIGDSITEGWEGAPAVWGRYYAPRGAVNLGVDSDKIQHILWRLDHGEARGVAPRVAVVMAGTNNLGDNTDDQIVAGVAAVVKKLRDALPRTRILLLGIFPRGARPDATRARIASINARLSRLDDGRFVRFLDLAPAFLGPDGNIGEDVMSDYLHPTPKGYRLWAEAMEPTLWTLMERE